MGGREIEIIDDTVEWLIYSEVAIFGLNYPTQDAAKVIKPN